MQGDFQPQLSMIRVDKPIIEIEIDLYMSAIVVHGGGKNGSNQVLILKLFLGQQRNTAPQVL